MLFEVIHVSLFLPFTKIMLADDQLIITLRWLETFKLLSLKTHTLRNENTRVLNLESEKET